MAYESELSKLKAEKAKITEMQARQEGQCRNLHDKVETLAEKNRGLKLDNEVKHRQVNLALLMLCGLLTVCILYFTLYSILLTRNCLWRASFNETVL